MQDFYVIPLYCALFLTFIGHVISLDSDVTSEMGKKYIKRCSVGFHLRLCWFLLEIKYSGTHFDA